VGPIVALDAVIEEKNSQPLPGLEPPIIQLVTQRYTAELFWLLHSHGWRDNVKMGVKKQIVTASTVFVWLRIGTSGGLL
jgi:hypothetical protein